MASGNKAGSPSSKAPGGEPGRVGSRRRLGRYAGLFAGCVAVAVGVVLAVVHLTPPDESTSGPKDAPPAQELSAAGSTITLPSTACPATAEELQQEAVQVVEELQARFPQLPESLHLAATLYAELRQTAKAEEIWRKCVALAPAQVGPRVGLATAMMDRGDDEMAVAMLEAALADDCSSPELYHQMAAALTKLGRLEEAEEVLEKGVAAYPQVPENWLSLGQTQIQLGQFTEAESSLRKAMALGGQSADACFAMANACARQGKHDEAARFRARFSELKANRPERMGQRFQVVYSAALRQIAMSSFGNAGAVYARQGDPAEAERLFVRALALDPENSEILRELARLYLKLGRIGDARVVQVRLVELEPQNVFNHVNLASVSARLGDYESAEAALKQAIDLRPDIAITHLSLAQLYLQTGRLEQARSLAERAVQREPTVQAYAVLAAVCQQLGDSAAAEAALEMVRKRSARDPRPDQTAPQRP